MKLLKYCIISIAEFLVAAVFTAYFYLNSPLSNEEKIIYIEKGSGLYAIGDKLKSEGLVRFPPVFRLLTKIVALKGITIHSGEYLFKARITPFEMFKIFKDRKVYYRSITFAEGLTNHSILKLIAENEYLSGELPAIEELQEGTLLPETYKFQRGDTRISILEQMQGAMTKLLTAAWQERDVDIAVKTPEEALILASVVEKETGIPTERKLVASVFDNRLKKNMRLQSDPTAVYGYTKGDVSKENDMTASQFLKIDSPYNTYKNGGLMPTPICNAGKDSIMAVLHPEKTDFIFFVATGNGGHNFSTTYEEHKAFVDKLRSVRLEQKNSEQKSEVKQDDNSADK